MVRECRFSSLRTHLHFCSAQRLQSIAYLLVIINTWKMHTVQSFVPIALMIVKMLLPKITKPRKAYTDQWTRDSSSLATFLISFFPSGLTSAVPRLVMFSAYLSLFKRCDLGSGMIYRSQVGIRLQIIVKSFSKSCLLHFLFFVATSKNEGGEIEWLGPNVVVVATRFGRFGPTSPAHARMEWI